jgi:hypothetical protein
MSDSDRGAGPVPDDPTDGSVPDGTTAPSPPSPEEPV